MIKKYIYGEKEYYTEQEVRGAIFKTKRKVFGVAPKENVAEFWEKFGVTYIEEQEPLEAVKQQKLTLIKRVFLAWRNNQATLTSSLGFEVDSNERANMDVNGLLVAHEDDRDSHITFRDANNEFHSLTYDQVKTLQKEIVENGVYAYSQKWMLDAQVEKATSNEEVDAVQVNFVGKNFLEG